MYVWNAGGTDNVDRWPYRHASASRSDQYRFIADGAVPAQANSSAEAVAPVTSSPAEEALSAVLAFIHGVDRELTATAELGPEAV